MPRLIHSLQAKKMNYISNIPLLEPHRHIGHTGRTHRIIHMVSVCMFLCENHVTYM